MESTKGGVEARVRRKRLPDSRLAELLEVAASVFIRKGYDAASLNQIARLASASKNTLYSRFPDKESLFLAVIDRRMRHLSDDVTNFTPTEPLTDTLRRFSHRLLRSTLSEEQVALIRMISMESWRYPELGKQFYESGPRRAEEALASYFSAQMRLQRLKNADAQLMARQFISLITGSPIRWFVLGFEPTPPTKKALKAHVEAALQMFSDAYGTAKSRPGS